MIKDKNNTITDINGTKSWHKKKYLQTQEVYSKTIKYKPK